MLSRALYLFVWFCMGVLTLDTLHALSPLTLVGVAFVSIYLEKTHEAI